MQIFIVIIEKTEPYANLLLNTSTSGLGVCQLKYT